jgi:Cof subfamily protein (haloacid dehalogenase superfamily)
VIHPATAVRLIALDLDGTLIGDDLVIHERVRAAIARAQARGVAVTIVTGRMFAAARPFAHILGVSGPIVCYQGAGIFDATSGVLLAQTDVAQDVTRDVLARAKADHFHAQCYADDRLYVDAINRFSKRYTDLAQVEPVLVDSLERAFADRPTMKIVLVDEPERATAYVDTMKHFLGPRAYVTRSAPDFVEILDANVDKGRALGFVAAHHGIELRDVLAIGDSWNDLPLLRAAGIGVAMGSAPEELLAQADAVVGDVAHDGVAEAIERFVLSEKGRDGATAPAAHETVARRAHPHALDPHRGRHRRDRIRGVSCHNAPAAPRARRARADRGKRGDDRAGARRRAY